MLLSENKSFTPQSFIGSFSFDGCGDIGISLTLRLLLLSIIVIVSSSSPLLLCLLLLLAFTTREVSTSSERIEFIGNASFLEEEEAFKEDEGLEEEEEKPSKRPILFVSSPRSIRLSS
jgi:hypothetical protein